MKILLFKKGNIYQNKRNYSQKEGDQGSSICLKDVNFFIFHTELLIKYAINKDTIAASISPVNTNHLLRPFSAEKLGTIIIAANHPADKFTNRSDSSPDQINNILTINNLTAICQLVNDNFINSYINNKNLTAKFID